MARRPTGDDVSSFAYRELWRSIVVSSAPTRLNIRLAFVDYLLRCGCTKFESEEYAEDNIGNLLTKVAHVCTQWNAIGLPKPLHLSDQLGTAITWKHEKFFDQVGEQPLSSDFCDVLDWVQGLNGREFLFCCSAYLFVLGCGRVFITDSTGDGGLDVLGTQERDPYRGVCFLLQSKTAQGEIGKESLFSDYTKLMLLRRSMRWTNYEKAMGLDTTADGAAFIYVFAANREFNPAIVQAGRDLPVLLRSARQIAHALSKKADVSRWKKARSEIGPPQANLGRNLVVPFEAIIR